MHFNQNVEHLLLVSLHKDCLSETCDTRERMTSLVELHIVILFNTYAIK